MQIEKRAKNPTDFAHGLEKQELRWPTTGQGGTLLGEGHLQPGSPPPPETAPPPPTEARGGGRADGAVTTPPPGSQPRGLPGKPPNRRAAEQSAAGGERAGLRACGVTLAFRPQFPQAQSEARPARPPPPPPGLRAQDPRPTVTGRLRPFPPAARLPARRGPAPPPPRPRPRGLPAIWETNASATRDMAAAGPWTRACAPRPSAPARPRDPGGAPAANEPGWARARTRRRHLSRRGPAARLPPGRPGTSGVADSARRHFRLLRPARPGPAGAPEDEALRV